MMEKENEGFLPSLKFLSLFLLKVFIGAPKVVLGLWLKLSLKDILCNFLSIGEQ